MLRRYITEEPLEQLEPVCTVSDIIRLQEDCKKVYVHEELLEYMVNLVQATRKPGKGQGVSPRGTLALLRASQGYAMVQGRDYVVPEDIKEVAIMVLAHRVVSANGMQEQKTAVIQGLLKSVPVPTEDFTKR